MPLADVFKEISKQTGNAIIDQRREQGDDSGAMRVKVDFDKTPFWRALDDVLDQTDLTLYEFTSERGAYVVSRPPGAGPRSTGAFYAGLFRVEGARFEAVRDLRNAKRRFAEVLHGGRVGAALAAVRHRATAQPDYATGDAGDAIAVGNADAEPEAMIRGSSSAVELEIPFELPPRKVEKIGLLKGKFLAIVPGPLQDFRFRDLPVAAPTHRRNAWSSARRARR